MIARFFYTMLVMLDRHQLLMIYICKNNKSEKNYGYDAKDRGMVP